MTSIPLASLALLLACGAPHTRASTPRPPPEVTSATGATAPVSALGPVGRVGTGDSTRLVASGAGGWAVVCEARVDTDGDGVLAFSSGAGHRTVGDEARPYFVQGVGPGEPIDDFLAADADGRWVALARGGQAWLHDSDDASGRALGAMPEEPRRENHFHPFFSFGGGALAYVTAERGLVVRDLATGVERTIPPIEGRLVLVTAWQGAVSTDWVVEDTNANGELDLSGLTTHPVPPDASPCAPREGDGLRPPPRGSDRIARHVFWWSETGIVEEAPPGLPIAVRPTGMFLDRDGGTVRISPPGSPAPRETPLGEGVHVLAVSQDGRGWVARDARSRLHFVRDGARTELGLDVVAEDVELFVEGDLLALASSETIVDLRTGRVIPVPGRMLRRARGVVVASIDSEWTVTDASTGAVRREAGTLRALHGRHALVGDGYVSDVIDVLTGEVRGRIEPAVWAVADDGRALTSPVPADGPIGPGPYAWVSPAR